MMFRSGTESRTRIYKQEQFDGENIRLGSQGKHKILQKISTECLTHETMNCLAKGFVVNILSLNKGMKDTRSNETLSVTMS